MNFLQFTIDHTDAIKHAIYSIGRLDVKNSGDVVSFDDVLLDLDILNCRKDIIFRKPTTTSRPLSGGTRGPSKVISQRHFGDVLADQPLQIRFDDCDLCLACQVSSLLSIALSSVRQRSDNAQNPRIPNRGDPRRVGTAAFLTKGPLWHVSYASESSR